MKPKLNAIEQSVIRDLERLAARWPKTLMLFSNSGSLSVIKLDGPGIQPKPDRDIYRRREVLYLGNQIPNDGGCLPSGEDDEPPATCPTPVRRR